MSEKNFHNKEFNVLGKKVTAPTKKLDTFDAPEHVNLVKFETEELTSYCPVTSQPDYYTATLEYNPDKLCIESKSLKLYLWSFREEKLFAESLAQEICNDIFDAINPHWCKITLLQSVRGGLKLTAVAERKK